MKCTNCGHEVPAGAKFCTDCGAKLDRACPQCGGVVGPQARFCTQCGAKLSGSGASGAQAGGAQEVESIVLAPLAVELPACRVAIQEVSAEGPNENGDLSITVRYEVSNDTAEDWEYLEVRTQLLDAGGRVVDETRDTQEQTISAGESAEFEASLWGVKAKALGPVPEHAHVVVSVVACGMGQAVLGEMAIPAEPISPVALPSCTVGDVLAVVSGNLWKTEPDDDKDARVEVKLLVQNLTARHLPKVQLVADVTDKAGRELLDAGSYEDVRPGAVCLVSGSGYAKDKKLAGAKTTLSIRTYYPVAAGAVQQQGITVAASESSESSSDSKWPFPTEDESESNDSSQEDGDDTDQSIGDGFSINGGWEGTTCRWFVALKSIGKNQMAGAVAGYSGGGTFQVERFYARTDGNEFESLWIDFTDRVGGDEIEFESLDADILQVCEEGLDCIWQWNDQDEWSDSDRVVLRKGKRSRLESDGDMLILTSGSVSLIRGICEMAGLTAGPSEK